jgi:hypothetical protein
MPLLGAVSGEECTGGFARLDPEHWWIAIDDPDASATTKEYGERRSIADFPNYRDSRPLPTVVCRANVTQKDAGSGCRLDSDTDFHG